MKSFFKIFFASFTALIVFSVFCFILGLAIIGILIAPDKPVIKSNSVLVLDLSKSFHEQEYMDPMQLFTSRDAGSTPGLYDVVRMLEHATSDSAIKLLYIKASNNANGFATSDELRRAVENFKSSGKKVISYGETMDQKSYFVASAGNEVYCHPNGGLDWSGLSADVMFFKGLIDKLEIEPQIIYAGKYKSATEPFRLTKMSDANREQMTDLVNMLYNNLLTKTGEARGVSTDYLHSLAIDGVIETAGDAVRAKLIDSLMYNDQLQKRILTMLGKKAEEEISFVSMEKYAKARKFKSGKGSKIAVLYAEGDIMDGQTDAERVIDSENYIRLLRKIRLNKDIKGVVLRVNSPGGSALASDGIWREITLIKKEKPVVVSMGDYAASGGYYISCAADSIFAEAGTITGSIGVFSIIPNFKNLMNNKLGITFDGVKTAPYADMGNLTRPMTDAEKRKFQFTVDTIYHVFKSRVAEGRKLSMEMVDSLAQGRVYTGTEAVANKLVDRIGSLNDAIRSVSALADLKEYRLEEYPEKKNLIEQLLGTSASLKENEMKDALGEQQIRLLRQLRQLQSMMQGPQARMGMVPEFY